MKAHENVHKLYQQQLLSEGVLKEDDIKRMSEHIGGGAAHNVICGCRSAYSSVSVVRCICCETCMLCLLVRW